MTHTDQRTCVYSGPALLLGVGDLDLLVDAAVTLPAETALDEPGPQYRWEARATLKQLELLDTWWAPSTRLRTAVTLRVPIGDDGAYDVEAWINDFEATFHKDGPDVAAVLRGRTPWPGRREEDAVDQCAECLVHVIRGRVHWVHAPVGLEVPCARLPVARHRGGAMTRSDAATGDLGSSRNRRLDPAINCLTSSRTDETVT